MLQIIFQLVFQHQLQIVFNWRFCFPCPAFRLEDRPLPPTSLPVPPLLTPTPTPFSAPRQFSLGSGNYKNNSLLTLLDVRKRGGSSVAILAQARLLLHVGFVIVCRL